MDINKFAKFDEIPSLPVRDIKEKPKCRVRKDGRTSENSIPLQTQFAGGIMTHMKCEIGCMHAQPV